MTGKPPTKDKKAEQPEELVGLEKKFGKEPKVSPEENPWSWH